LSRIVNGSQDKLQELKLGCMNILVKF